MFNVKKLLQIMHFSLTYISRLFSVVAVCSFIFYHMSNFFHISLYIKNISGNILAYSAVVAVICTILSMLISIKESDIDAKRN